MPKIGYAVSYAVEQAELAKIGLAVKPEWSKVTSLFQKSNEDEDFAARRLIIHNVGEMFIALGYTLRTNHTGTIPYQFPLYKLKIIHGVDVLLEQLVAQFPVCVEIYDKQNGKGYGKVASEHVTQVRQQIIDMLYKRI